MNSLFFYRGLFVHFYFTADVEFSKNANSATAVGSYTHIVVFVWRQLEFAFFGALTSVGALFYFHRRKTQRHTKGEKQ
ncbi:MAG: hypothetical protein IKC31_02610 [Clostridia bacterium]|nr:hypothetical protein [Clostridia bacterium]